MGYLAQHKLIIVVVILFVAIGIWYGMSSSSSTPILLTTDESGTLIQSGSGESADQDLVGSLLVLRSVTLAGDVFSDPGFLVLQDFSTPIVPEPVGRTNPFAPLSGNAQANQSTSHEAQLFAPQR
jgi:hypothetical protein